MTFFNLLLKLNLIIIMALTSFFLPAAAAPSYTRTRRLMGTLCEITADVPQAVTSAFEEIGRIEKILTTYDALSEVSRLNKTPGVFTPVSETLWDVLEISKTLSKETGGAFDPTYSSSPEARGMEKIAFDPKNKSVRLPQGGRLDFGGIGKGYALDSAARVLRAAGVRSAFINFGGQVLALTPPRESRAWPVDIAAPDKSRRPVRTLYLHTGSAATSGVSERPAHIRHPESGLPVKSDQSVTVIAKNGASADAWSTALFVSGRKTRHPAFSDCAAWTSPGFFRPRTRLTGDCSSYTKQP